MSCVLVNLPNQDAKYQSSSAGMWGLERGCARAGH